MSKEYLFLRLVLGYVCAGHVLTGVLALISGKQAIRLGSRLYGASFEPTEQFQYALRPLGAFMLSLAFLQGMAIWRPRRYKAVIDATLALLLLRTAQRIVFARDVSTIFGIPLRRHWINTLVIHGAAPLLLLARSLAFRQGVVEQQLMRLTAD